MLKKLYQYCFYTFLVGLVFFALVPSPSHASIIDDLKKQIAEKGEEIERAKAQIAHTLRLISMNDEKNVLAVVLAGGSFSDIFSQQQYLIGLQREIEKNITDLKTFKDELTLFK